MKIISTNIGEKREVTWKKKTVTTGIFKFPVETPIFLDTEEVKGDAVCNRKYHGGIEQAVYGYASNHYEYWQKLYPALDWKYGMFGENLTVDNLDESTIHVGDTFQVGNVILEATKPREPCMKLGVRFQDMKIVKQFWEQDYSGIYFKVLQTGTVQKGDAFTQLKSCPKNLTIAEVYQQKKNQ
jgi:MOSC domain-containing protein YiiM